MVRTSLALPLCSLVAVLTACGGGGKKSESTPIPDNTAPSITAPNNVAGAPPSFSRTLPVGATDTIVFTATDPESDPLTWQVSADATAAAAAGVTFPAPQNGSTLTITLGAAVAPAAVTLTIFVEDLRGAAAAIDLRIVRSGPPTISAVLPTSAFTSRGQAVRITGTALRLGGAAITTAAFDGLAATGLSIVSDTEVRCTTPTSAATGDTVVAVSTQFGTASLPATAFRMHSFPPDLFGTDTRLDAGSASDVEVARDGDTVHAVWREGTTVVHRVSGDRGASWSAAQPLSGAEAATEPQLLVAGADVLVAWIGDASSVWVRRSTDAGATFAAAQRLDPASPVTPASRPRLARDGAFGLAVWLAGDTSLGAGQVVAASTTDGGAAWTTPNTISANGVNQRNHAVHAGGGVGIVLFEDDRLGAPVRGAYVARTIDSGSTWQTAVRLNGQGTAAGDVRLAGGSTRVYATWVQNGALLLSSSADRGAVWSTTIVTLQTTQFGAVTQPQLTGDDDQLTAVCVVGGTSIRATRFTPLGATVQNQTVENAATASAEPRVATSGNYVFAAWREGDVGAGTARIQYGVSTDNGATWQAATGFGDGLAAQQAPRLVLDGANVLFAWADSRAAGGAVFSNRTEF